MRILPKLRRNDPEMNIAQNELHLVPIGSSGVEAYRACQDLLGHPPPHSSAILSHIEDRNLLKKDIPQNRTIMVDTRGTGQDARVGYSKAKTRDDLLLPVLDSSEQVALLTTGFIGGGTMAGAGARVVELLGERGLCSISVCKVPYANRASHQQLENLSFFFKKTDAVCREQPSSPFLRLLVSDATGNDIQAANEEMGTIPAAMLSASFVRGNEMSNIGNAMTSGRSPSPSSWTAALLDAEVRLHPESPEASVSMLEDRIKKEFKTGLLTTMSGIPFSFEPEELTAPGGFLLGPEEVVNNSTFLSIINGAVRSELEKRRNPGFLPAPELWQIWSDSTLRLLLIVKGIKPDFPVVER